MPDQTRAPNFIIAGATRIGTTTPHTILSQSPDIYMLPEKKLNFFRHYDFYANGTEHHESFFEPADNSYAAEIEKCEALLGRDLSMWKNQNTTT